MRKRHAHSRLLPGIDPLEDRVMLTGSSSESPGLGHPATLTTSLSLQLPDVHQLTGVDVAHQQGFTGQGQTVVIIDSGVAYDHPALGAGFGESYHVVGGWDFTEENDADPYDDAPAGYHGTHVAGIIASQDAQHLGVAPEVDVVALRVFNDQGRGKLSWLESSLQWVIEHQHSFEHPITTINMSIGTSWNDSELPDYADLEDELAELKKMGVLVAAAAGNRFDAEVGLSYPAVSTHVVAAASSDANGQLSEFSQRDDRVLVVPGERITSTVPDFLEDFNGQTDDYYAASGTSMAAPYVAGVSILVRQAMEQAGIEDISVDAIYDILRDTADEVFDPITQRTYQQVNVAQALEALAPDALPTPPMSLVRQVGNELFVTDTPGDDQVQVDQRGFVLINGQRFTFDAEQIAQISVTSQAGTDRLTIDVRQPQAHVELSPFQVDLQSETSSITAHGFHRADVIERSAGLTAVFAGNADRNHLVIQPSYSSMTTGGSANYVHAATHVVAQANDANDSVIIFDSPSDDVVSIHPSSVHLQNEQLQADAYGYSSYTVKSVNGGDDRVDIEGSAGSDIIRAKDTFISFFGAGVSAYAYGFDTRTVDGQGGADRAKLYASPDDDLCQVSPEQVHLTTPHTATRLTNFRQVEAFAGQGNDELDFLGSPGDDVFIASPDVSIATFADSLYVAQGFARIQIDAAFGQDSVWMLDTREDDSFQLSADGGVVDGPGFHYDVQNAENLKARSRQGADTVLLFASSATDRVFADDDITTLRSADHTVIAEGFHEVEISDVERTDAITELLAEEMGPRLPNV